MLNLSLQVLMLLAGLRMVATALGTGLLPLVGPSPSVSEDPPSSTE